MPGTHHHGRAAALDAFLAALSKEEFFEAHEILEDFWIRYQGDDRDFYKGLIQAAVALHHAKTGNAVGASGVGVRARALLTPYAPSYQSVDVDAVLARLPSA